MPGPLRSAMVFLLGAASFAAWGQGAAVTIEQPAEYAKCLARTRPEVTTPEFPAGAEHDKGAIVRLGMTFRQAAAAPEVEVTYNNGAPGFAAAARDFASTYRVPCLPPGQVLVARQEFQFLDRTKEVLKSETEQDHPRIPESCMAAVRQWPRPLMPRGAYDGTNILVQYTFHAPDEPPEVRILFDGGSRRHAEEVRQVAKDFRLPCAERGKPLVATQLIKFVIVDDERRAQLKDEITLQQLLRLLKPADRKGVRFDFTTMACPFKVRVEPTMPYKPNGVWQIGVPSIDRIAFTRWLRGVTFDLPPDFMRTMIGEPTTVTVPCAVLDLT